MTSLLPSPAIKQFSIAIPNWETVAHNKLLPNSKRLASSHQTCFVSNIHPYLCPLCGFSTLDGNQIRRNSATLEGALYKLFESSNHSAGDGPGHSNKGDVGDRKVSTGKDCARLGYDFRSAIGPKSLYNYIDRTRISAKHVYVVIHIIFRCIKVLVYVVIHIYPDA